MDRWTFLRGWRLARHPSKVHGYMLVVEGREIPWAEDTSLLKSKNPSEDVGATAQLVPSSLDMYRVTALKVCHLTP